MSINTIGGTGVGLPSPLPLYPPATNGSPSVSQTNRVTLPPGGDFLLPSGTWNVKAGQFASMEFLDPVTNTWSILTGQDGSNTNQFTSDGTNYRIRNPLGFPTSAIITNGGTGFTAVPTITATPGSSTWLAIVGGALGQLNITTLLSNAGLSVLSGGSGANYSVPPTIHIAAPPSPGIPATAVATISGGSLATVTLVNPGAGYSSAPAVTVVPQSTDLNQANAVAGFRNAGLTAQLSGVGQVTGVLLVNEGNNPLTTSPALVFAGGNGSNAAATVIVPNTIVNYAVTAGGSGYNITPAIFVTGGNILSQTSGVGGQTNNPILSNFNVPQRQAIIATNLSGSGIGVIVTPNSGITDGGIYTAPPSGFAFPGPTGFVSAFGASATVTLTLGQVADTVFITPA